MFHKSVLRDCISMCLDICTINIRVSIRVRGLHLVFLSDLESGPDQSSPARVSVSSARGKYHPWEAGFVSEFKTYFLQSSACPFFFELSHHVHFCGFSIASTKENSTAFTVSMGSHLCRLRVSTFTLEDKLLVQSPLVQIVWLDHIGQSASRMDQVGSYIHDACMSG